MFQLSDVSTPLSLNCGKKKTLKHVSGNSTSTKIVCSAAVVNPQTTSAKTHGLGRPARRARQSGHQPGNNNNTAPSSNPETTSTTPLTPIISTNAPATGCASN